MIPQKKNNWSTKLKNKNKKSGPSQQTMKNITGGKSTTQKDLK